MLSWSEVVRHPDFYLLILLAGLILAALAFLLFWRKYTYLKRCRLTTGTLVDLVRRSAMEGNLWCTRIEFEDDNADKYEVEFTGAGPNPSYVRTGTLQIYYDPENPQNAFSSEFWRLWLWEVFIALLAGLFLWAAWVNVA